MREEEQSPQDELEYHLRAALYAITPESWLLLCGASLVAGLTIMFAVDQFNVAEERPADTQITVNVSVPVNVQAETIVIQGASPKDDSRIHDPVQKDISEPKEAVKQCSSAIESTSPTPNSPEPKATERVGRILRVRDLLVEFELGTSQGLQEGDSIAILLKGTYPQLSAPARVVRVATSQSVAEIQVNQFRHQSYVRVGDAVVVTQ